MADSYLEFILSTHPNYDKYIDQWHQNIRGYWGGREWKDGRYLRGYESDFNTPGETINTYQTNPDGSVVAKIKAKLVQGVSSQDTNRGEDEILDGTFYGEKLQSTPWYNYVKLITSEYNAMLYRNPPNRQLPDNPDLQAFLNDVDGEGNSIDEFMSMVDIYTTIFGVCHVGCYKPLDSDIPKWKIHMPTDVLNWEYSYDVEGNLKLNEILIEIDNTDTHQVFRYMSADSIDTIFVGKDDDYEIPLDDPGVEQIEDNVYRFRQENALGYVPIKTFYQSTKIYNNVGTTVINDVSDISRSVYNYLSEIYASVTYSSHPTLIVDQGTNSLNDGKINSEPGAVITVEAGLTGEPAYVYQFVSPELSSLEQIQKIIDSQIDKLSQIAMLRSEDLIKASRSGEQIEVYDDKLAAQIRRKATNLENGEFKLWKIWFDWINQQPPAELAISYNRQFNKKALQHELDEIALSMRVLENYNTMFGAGAVPEESYSSAEQAEGRAQELGGSGFHSHEQEDGSVIYMPFATHAEFETAYRAENNIQEDPEEELFKTEMRDKIRERLSQLLNATTTDNGF